MSATITDKFKKEILQDLHTSFHGAFDSDANPDSSDYYYIGVGRSQEWPDNDEPPAPTPSQETISSFQSSLSGVKRVLDQSYVVPRYNWTAGAVYVAWSDKHHSDVTVGALQDIFGPYYVITEENNVYVCLAQGISDEGQVNNSIYKPEEIHTQPFVAGPDGYVWRFLYNVGTYNSRRYLTSEWLPVEHILDSSQGGPAADTLSASRLGQALVQLQSKEGQILSIEVDSGGIGYTSAPTVTIHPDPDNAPTETASAYARLDENGRISQVILKDSVTAPSFSLGEGYNNKTWVTVSGGGGYGASLRAAVHTETGGLGFDPRNDLNSSSMMYSVRLIGDELKTLNIDNDFRQVGLVKNPLKDGNNVDSDFVNLRGNALKKLFVGSGINEDFTNLDNTVTGLSSGATALLDYYSVEIDSDCCDENNNVTNNILYVHQTAETGFVPFNIGEAVELNFNGGIATVVGHSDSSVPALRPADVDAYSGEVMYIDNRLYIERDADQTEDIKIIIDL